MASVDKPTLAPRGRRSLQDLNGRLTAQQTSLVKAYAEGYPDFLNRSYYIDQRTRRRMAFRLRAVDLYRFVAAWAVEPVACIHFLNRTIANLIDSSRFARYVEAAVDLERLMDRETFRADDARIHRGIPSYFMDGYTDMGLFAMPSARASREKIKVNKIDVREKLLEARRQGVLRSEPPHALLESYYDAVRRDLVFDDPSVVSISREFGDSSVSLAQYFDRGVGVCRHLALTYQLYLQEAGIPSRLVKGNLRLYGVIGRHAWNLAFILGRVALIDVTLPDVDSSPFILTGASQEEVYALAKAKERSYVATPDEQNNFKIGRTEENDLGRELPQTLVSKVRLGT